MGEKVGSQGAAPAVLEKVIDDGERRRHVADDSRVNWSNNKDTRKTRGYWGVTGSEAMP